METHVGLFETLEVNAAGIGDAGSRTPVNVARDVTVTMEHGEADVTTRGSQGFENTHKTKKRLEFAWDMVYDPDDAGFVLVKTAYDAAPSDAASKIGVWALDENSAGPKADCHIFKFEIGEPLDGVTMVSCVAKPCRSDDAPDWEDGN